MSSQLSITIEEQELIDNYLNGALSGAELISFEQRLQNDAEWKEKVSSVQLTSIAIGEAALRQKLNDFHSTGTVNKNTAPVIKMPAYKKWIAAAAVLAVVLLAGKLLFFNLSSTQKLFTEYYKQDPGLATEMGVSDNYSFDRAMVDYKTGDFNKALSAWNNMLADHPQNDTLHFFIGNARMGNKEWSAAIESFNKVIALPASSFKNDANWYKGMALLQMNKTAEAIASIEASDHPQKNALISKLKK